MNQTEFQALQSDLRSLKKAMSRVKWCLLCVIGGAMVFCAAGFQPHGGAAILEAKQIVLKNKDGKVVAKLDASQDDLPLLLFYDKDGKRRMQLGITDGAVGLDIRHAKDDTLPLVSLSANEVGSTQLDLSALDGKRISLLCTDKPDDGAEITLGTMLGSYHHVRMATQLGIHFIEFATESANVEEKSVPRVILGVDPEKGPGLTLFDKNGKNRLELESAGNGTSRIDFRDEKGKSILVLPQR